MQTARSATSTATCAASASSSAVDTASLAALAEMSALTVAVQLAPQHTRQDFVLCTFVYLSLCAWYFCTSYFVLCSNLGTALPAVLTAMHAAYHWLFQCIWHSNTSHFDLWQFWLSSISLVSLVSLAFFSSLALGFSFRTSCFCASYLCYAASSCSKQTQQANAASKRSKQTQQANAASRRSKQTHQDASKQQLCKQCKHRNLRSSTSAYSIWLPLPALQSAVSLQHLLPTADCIAAVQVLHTAQQRCKHSNLQSASQQYKRSIATCAVGTAIGREELCTLYFGSLDLCFSLALVLLVLCTLYFVAMQDAAAAHATNAV